MLPQEVRNPVILPCNHPLVQLLLRYLHEKHGYCGYKSLIHEASQNYWILEVRNMSKALTANKSASLSCSPEKNCSTRRKLRKKTLDQLMGQIPSLRVAAGFPPFSDTAIDMFGPLHIKLIWKTLKEAQVVIFASMTTRAVHLELVNDKTAFLMAFSRFMSLRGHLRVCWSDCGTNFVGAQSYLRENVQSWDIPKIQGVLCKEFSRDFKWQ